jgi:hypothetical protein
MANFEYDPELTDLQNEQRKEQWSAALRERCLPETKAMAEYTFSKRALLADPVKRRAAISGIVYAVSIFPDDWSIEAFIDKIMELDKQEKGNIHHQVFELLVPKKVTLNEMNDLKDAEKLTELLDELLDAIVSEDVEEYIQYHS